MNEASVNNAISTATAVVAAPLHWLDVLVTSLLSGAVTLAVGVLTIVVFTIIAWWRPIGVAPFLRWVIASAAGAAAAALYVADSSARFGAATWAYWLCAVIVSIAVLLLLLMGMIVAGVRSLWRLGGRAADTGNPGATADTPRPPADSGAA